MIRSVSQPLDRARRGLLPLALGSLLLLTACSGEAPPEPVAEFTRPIKTATFGRVRERTTFSYPGRVYPNRTVERGFEVGGRLMELAAIDGMPGESSAVRVVAGGRVTRRNVKMGRILEGDRIELLDGLGLGEVVATAGVRYLREGLWVRPLE